ncbi:hypothetical protein HUJ05_006105 [Dendroctonus ponderosae]|nr:hypothetical protein HUJ05_006105 [Dendroctonus ponderosae]
MHKQIDAFLSNRSDFLSFLDKDIAKNVQLQAEIEATLKSLKGTREQVKELSKQPEHTALIPLCKKLYMPGVVVHTGEYLVTRTAYPHSYSVLKTLDQTVSHLEGLTIDQRDQLQKAELAVAQLTERKKLLLGQRDEDIVAEQQFADDLEYQSLAEEVSEMPNEIRSEKGVAVKVGAFFEILEYDSGS